MPGTVRNLKALGTLSAVATVAAAGLVLPNSSAQAVEIVTASFNRVSPAAVTLVQYKIRSRGISAAEHQFGERPWAEIKQGRRGNPGSIPRGDVMRSYRQFQSQ